MKLYSDTKKQTASDEKYTPRYAVLPIIKYLPKDAVVWCPFDTENSEFVLALRENGFNVIYSHLLLGQDFYEYEPEHWDIIVSNPPFKGKRQIFERCLSFDKPFALIMSNLTLNDSFPCRLFKDRELQLLMFDKRIQYNDLECIPFSSSYFCYNILPRQIIFEHLEVVKGEFSRMQADMEMLL